MKRFRTITLVALLAIMLASCAQPTPEVVVQTQVVEKEVIQTVVVQTQVVEREVVTEVTVPPTRSDGLPVYTGGPVELRMGWWGNDDRAERTLKVIELFHEAYPEITVLGEPDGGAGDHF
jgi:hypothetical protein